MARPLSPRSKGVYACMDAQVLTEGAIRAARGGDVERGIQLMELALEYYRAEAGKLEGLSVWPKPSR